ncbi:MAG: DUF1549 domain-containing protein, partial [Pirellulaceae bacterium]|nr:DUF1549 domain-containing protein [Pirellulaceae bacterium]
MRLLFLLAGLCFSSHVLMADGATSPDRVGVTFADDVQPILRRHCYRCHGSKNQEAGLQLNQRDTAIGDESNSIVVKHVADESLLIQRLVDPELGDIMPLDGQRLSKGEIDTLRRWINDGAPWPDELAEANHWAYEPIVRPATPNASDTATSPIDQFIQSRLKRRGLRPSDPIDRARLIRRVSLALIGLPPTPADVHGFVNDPAPDAYEKVVDRLLRSQHYGERWAVPWLDLARYADSNGFQADQIRDNWAYRDWVIRSFNDDLPFNDFVIDQLAGDLRPNPTTDQMIATGFHRMTTCNVEAGVHPEANRTNQIVDRVNTTATVFLGTTLECAQCHDHKYDPFTQKDYYKLFAYFNNTPLEVKNTSGVTWDFYGPTMDLPMDPAQQERYERLTREIETLHSDRQEIVKQSDSDFQPWLDALRDKISNSAQWQTVKPIAFETTGGEDFEIQDDGAVLLSGTVPDTVEHRFTIARRDTTITAIKVDLLIDDSIPGKGPGRGDEKRSNVILSELTCESKIDSKVQSIALQDPVADFSQTNWDVAEAIDGNRKSG